MEHYNQLLRIDFADPAWQYRVKHISWRQELVARAVGLGRHQELYVVDATAGLGQDSYVLALLGAHVICIERSPVVATLLLDAVRRAQEAHLRGANRMTVVHADALDFMEQRRAEGGCDVVYLDPMYPGREEQSALSKKSLRILRDMVGNDSDADKLLEPALRLAHKRVVVKRPKGADFLAGKPPSWQLKGSSSRFDIYLLPTVETNLK